MMHSLVSSEHIPQIVNKLCHIAHLKKTIQKYSTTAIKLQTLPQGRLCNQKA